MVPANPRTQPARYLLWRLNPAPSILVILPLALTLVRFYYEWFYKVE